jgi:hypothetical protein
MGLLKKFKGAVKKITKPISRFLDKVVPNEIKPFLPYAAAAVPFLAPTAGIFGSMSGRAALSGGSNLLAQLAQEGSEGDFSGLSALLAAGTGALTAPGRTVVGPAGETISSSPSASEFLSSKAAGMDTGIVKSGLEGLAGVSEGLQKTGSVLRPGGLKPEGIMDLGKAALTPFTQGSVDLGMATARKALKDYEDELAAYEAETGEAQIASDSARRSAIIAAMTAGQHSQDVIDETLSLLGLKDGGVVKMKDGGIMDLGGKEMDLRGGGFVPIGKKERADDVPARLSKNEFVMTADAVRAAGGGNINEGARRMYETMNRLEARA